jgi:hypothetical protein
MKQAFESQLTVNVTLKIGAGAEVVEVHALAEQVVGARINF